MESETDDAFYVVKKGGIVGIYKSLSDCLAVTSLDPSIPVFKGNGLPKNAEEYLASQGLKNAAYSIEALDVQRDLFGKLVACPFQDINRVISSPSNAPNPQEDLMTAYNCVETEVDSSNISSCILEFDGASKGNPGPAGAGAVLRAEDGSVVSRLREGVGIATNNVAEYRAVILGLKHALRKGFKHIHVQGDSNLVVMQIQGLWKIKSQNLVDLCREAKELKNKFTTFHIKHIPREYNSQADAQANLAINLRDGQVEEDCHVKVTKHLWG